MTIDPIRRRWQCMLQRCYQPKSPYYAKGITVCDEWRNSYATFQEWAISEGFQPWLELERKDNKGDYSPNNCRWATREDQATNRSNTRFLTAFGETKLLDHWPSDERCKVAYHTLWARIKSGWGAELAIITPSMRRMKKKSPVELPERLSSILTL